MGDAGQHPGVGEAGIEHRALVDEVGEPVGSVLLVYLDPGLVTLGGEEFGQRVRIAVSWAAESTPGSGA